VPVMPRVKSKLRTPTVDDKTFLIDLTNTAYKKLVIDHFSKWDEKSHKNYFKKKLEKAIY
jgi:hypothetical protein